MLELALTVLLWVVIAYISAPILIILFAGTMALILGTFELLGSVAKRISSRPWKGEPSPLAGHVAAHLERRYRSMEKEASESRPKKQGHA